MLTLCQHVSAVFHMALHVQQALAHLLAHVWRSLCPIPPASFTMLCMSSCKSKSAAACGRTLLSMHCMFGCSFNSRLLLQAVARAAQTSTQRAGVRMRSCVFASPS